MEYLLFCALFLLSAFFSAAETILFSLTSAQRMRIKERSPAAAERIERCIGDSAILLSTILVGNTLVNFAIATLGYRILDAAFPRFGGIAAVPSVTALLLVFGEITPKRIALARAERLAPVCARLLVFWRGFLKPFTAAFSFSSRAFAGAVVQERKALSDAELVSVIEDAAESGEFSQSDAEMIEGVLRLSELHASDEMTPRVDMVGYDIDLPEAERLERNREARHAYLPAFRRTPDAIEGVYCVATGKIEDALFVPEQVGLDDLLYTLRKSGKPMAVVLDEYGGTAGLITLNDVMELVMGPGVFGGGDAEPKMVKTGKNVWEIDGRVSIDEINRDLGLELSAEDTDRLSGWVASHAERIPHAGQQIVAQGCRATVLKRRKRRVVSVKLEVLEYPEADTDEDLIAETDEQVEKTEEDNK